MSARQLMIERDERVFRFIASSNDALCASQVYEAMKETDTRERVNCSITRLKENGRLRGILKKTIIDSGGKKHWQRVWFYLAR